MRSGCASAQVRFGRTAVSGQLLLPSYFVNYHIRPHSPTLRPGDCFALKVGAFNPMRRTLTIDTSLTGFTKTGLNRTLALPAVVAELLVEQISNLRDPADPEALGECKKVPRASCPGEDHLLSPVDWVQCGDAASRLAAVGTIAAVGAAVWLTVQEGKRRSAEDRRQAERITAWVAADDPEGSLVVSLGDASRGGLRPNAPLQWRNFVSQLPPGETRVEVDWTTGANGRPSVGIAFQDAAGVTGGTVGNTNRRTFPDIPQARP
jgi:hypothetical protein